MSAIGDARAVLDYFVGPTTPRPVTQATVIGSYADGGVVREFETTDTDRARILAAGRHARSDYASSIGKPDGLLWLAVIPTDAKGRCAQCAPIGVTQARHVPEYCLRGLR